MEISEFTNCEYPQYSVLMSVYIKEKPEFLKLALDSMFNQTVPPAEIVLVEDGPLTTELLCSMSIPQNTAKSSKE